MFRPDAARVHAEVVEGRPFRDESSEEDKGVSMRKFLAPFPISLDMEVAVSVSPNGSLPLPTSQPALELAQEPLCFVSRPSPLVSHIANYTTDYTEYTEHIGRQLLAALSERGAA